MTDEIWKPITDCPGYEVSTLGRVRSVDRIDTLRNGNKRSLKGKILTLRPDPEGYVRAVLRVNHERKHIMVHRLVAITFLGKQEGKEVNHINCIRDDNRLENLEWVTHKKNCNWSAKYNIKSPSKQIIGISKEDGSCVKFYSLNDAGRHGFNMRHVAQCCEGLRASHHGYTFHYIDG